MRDQVKTRRSGCGVRDRVTLWVAVRWVGDPLPGALGIEAHPPDVDIAPSFPAHRPETRGIEHAVESFVPAIESFVPSSAYGGWHVRFSYAARRMDHWVRRRCWLRFSY